MKTFLRGSGPECRKLVQELNIKKADLEQMDSLDDSPPSKHTIECKDDQTASAQLAPISCSHEKKPSKWDKYL